MYHLVPEGCSPSDFGTTLFAGKDYRERREILARLASAYLIIEGGPRTVHEAEVARGRGAVLLPVGRSGGFAGKLFPTLPCPQGVKPEDWDQLNDSLVHCEDLVETAGRILVTLLEANR